MQIFAELCLIDDLVDFWLSQFINASLPKIYCLIKKLGTPSWKNFFVRYHIYCFLWKLLQWLKLITCGYICKE